MATLTLRFAMIFALACALLGFAAQTARAQSFSVLYSFCSQSGCTDGATPNDSPIVDSEGNVYGTTLVGGGATDGGIAYEITGGTEKLLHNFNTFATGEFPEGGLIRDSSGNFYGTASSGGNDIVHSLCRGHGCGVVYELGPSGADTILFTFFDSDIHHVPNYDGYGPYGSLLSDGKGNLFGTTLGFGAKYTGSVFELSANGSEGVTHWFGSYKKDGKFPNGGLVMDSLGNIYGTTTRGGQYGAPRGELSGTIFEINAAGVESVLHSFGGRKEMQNGTGPNGGLILDASGNLYGTTITGGNLVNCTNGCGTVFAFSPAGMETVLYTFTGTPDGSAPTGGMIRDGQGNFYGTTASGGVNGAGTVFKMTPGGVETILYNFTGGADGQSPEGGLAMDGQGNLYGTTAGGGNQNELCAPPRGVTGCGVVFEVTP
ncbi:MAG: choice-of-anchor tandem repeat GloVer-containing protein [Terriglobales bacterium]